MPYELSWEPFGVVNRFSGIVSDEDLMAATEEVNSSPFFPTIKYQILDCSTIEKLDVTSATVQAVAIWDRRAAEINPDVRIAIITSAVFIRGMSNMYAYTHRGAGGSWATEMFESEQDARAWAVTPS